VENGRTTLIKQWIAVVVLQGDQIFHYYYVKEIILSGDFLCWWLLQMYYRSFSKHPLFHLSCGLVIKIL